VPQQEILPSVPNPQLCEDPAAIWVKAIAGGVHCPYWLSPQHATLPSARNPQVCLSPAQSWTKACSPLLENPASGDARPSSVRPAVSWTTPLSATSCVPSAGVSVCVSGEVALHAAIASNSQIAIVQNRPKVETVT
jgi:hypothetical protein